MWQDTFWGQSFCPRLWWKTAFHRSPDHTLCSFRSEVFLPLQWPSELRVHLLVFSDEPTSIILPLIGVYKTAHGNNDRSDESLGMPFPGFDNDAHCFLILFWTDTEVFVFGCVDASQSAGSANKRITGRDTNCEIRLDKLERFLVISDVSCSEGDAGCGFWGNSGLLRKQQGLGDLIPFDFSWYLLSLSYGLAELLLSFGYQGNGYQR